MKKTFVLFVLLLLVFSLAPATTASGPPHLRIILLNDVYVNESSSLLIQLVDGNQSYISGAAADINVTIRQNQSYLVHNAHPDELAGQRIYVLNFTTGATGQYSVYASYHGIVDMNLFVAEFKVSKNITEQQQRVETILWLEHTERGDILRQTMYQLNSLAIVYQNVTKKQEVLSVTDTITKELSDTAMQVLFYVLLLFGVIVISAVVYTRPRTKRKTYER